MNGTFTSYVLVRVVPGRLKFALSGPTPPRPHSRGRPPCRYVPRRDPRRNPRPDPRAHPHRHPPPRLPAAAPPTAASLARGRTFFRIRLLMANGCPQLTRRSDVIHRGSVR